MYGIPAFLLASPGFLNFHVGNTLIIYGQVLGALLAVSLVAFACLGYLRIRERTQTSCQHCLSDVPVEATVCGHCLHELPATEA